MEQTRFVSLVESAANMFISYTTAILAQVIIFPFYDVHVQLHENMSMALIFAIIGFFRNYGVRRLFNAAPWLKFKGVKNAQN